MKVRKLLNREKKYTNKAYARFKDEEPLSPFNMSANKFSLTGALIKCYPDCITRLKICAAIKLHLFRTYRYTGTIREWEDKKGWDYVDDLLRWLDI